MNHSSPADPKGLIFDIQGHSIHDGPGTRTTVFLSGCPMHCAWCANPEGLFRHPVEMHSHSKCVCCGRCIEACPYGAVTMAEAGQPPAQYRRTCDGCRTLDCVKACFHDALSVSGREITVDELMRIFQRDRHFWGSRGGVTFSGGEPLLQQEFMLAILRKCRQSTIHTCVETSAWISPDFFQSVMKYVDWVFVDIKHMDSRVHREMTGVDNDLVLRNIRALAKADWDGFAVIRVPIIPGQNDDEENIRATARFVRDVELEVINILPFHRLGESKYRQLGRKYEFAEQKPPTEKRMGEIKGLIQDHGLICFTGHDTPF